MYSKGSDREVSLELEATTWPQTQIAFAWAYLMFWPFRGCMVVSWCNSCPLANYQDFEMMEPVVAIVEDTTVVFGSPIWSWRSCQPASLVFGKHMIHLDPIVLKVNFLFFGDLGWCQYRCSWCRRSWYRYCSGAAVVLKISAGSNKDSLQRHHWCLPADDVVMYWFMMGVCSLNTLLSLLLFFCRWVKYSIYRCFLFTLTQVFK